MTRHTTTPPSALSAYFAAGKLAPVPLVVRLSEESSFSGRPRLQVYTTPADRAHGVAVIEAIMADAEGAKNLFRGSALTATEHNGLVLEVNDLPAVTRSNVIVPESVWSEIDLNVAAVTTQRQLMTKLGLGVRRGVLLAGPPGVGKTVICQVIAREMLGPFTVITVDARAGQSALAGVYKEAHTLGPTLIVLEDLDLIVGDRRKSSDTRALSEFLAVMDTDPSAPILILASTNDVTALDAASIRTARFDSIIEIGYPNRDAAAPDPLHVPAGSAGRRGRRSASRGCHLRQRDQWGGYPRDRAPHRARRRCRNTSWSGRHRAIRALQTPTSPEEPTCSANSD